MKYTGRIVTLILVFLINMIFTAHYYYRDGFVDWIEYLGYPILLPLSWCLVNNMIKQSFIPKMIL